MPIAGDTSVDDEVNRVLGSNLFARKLLKFNVDPDGNELLSVMALCALLVAKELHDINMTLIRTIRRIQ